MAVVAPSKPSYASLYDGYITFDPGAFNEDREFVACSCPFHDDNKASAGVSTTTGVFHCFVCEGDAEDGSLVLSPAQFLHRVAGTPLDEAYSLVDSYRVERNLITKTETFVNHLPAPSPRFQELYEKSQELINADNHIVREYTASKGVDYTTLRRAHIGYLPREYTHWKRDSLVFPYIHNGRVVGIRYRDIGGNKSGEPGCHFTLWGIDELDDASNAVIVAEGETDRLRVMQAVGDRYPVVSTPTAAFRREWAREFQGIQQVILIPQADEASLKMIDKAEAYLEHVHILNLPWRRKESGKDVENWLRYHPDQDLVDTLDAIVERASKRVLTGWEFEQAANEPRKWLIQNLLARRQICVIAGQPKAGKTWLFMNIIRSLLTREALCKIPSLKPPDDAPTPNILVCEEEGDIEGLLERINMTLKDVEWRNNTYWMHHMGVKLDSDVWIDRLSREIDTLKIDLLIVDPFSRTYDVDEDKASEMGQVWNRIARLLTIHKDLSVIVVHHFNKSGEIEDGWSGFRGSSRTAAEADLGIFVEKRPMKEGGGSKIKVEGRSIKPLIAGDGSEVFRLKFDQGLLYVPDGIVAAGEDGRLYEEVKRRGTWTLDDAQKGLGTSKITIRRWVEESADAHGNPTLELVYPPDGGPVYIQLAAI